MNNSWLQTLFQGLETTFFGGEPYVLDVRHHVTCLAALVRLVRHMAITFSKQQRCNKMSRAYCANLLFFFWGGAPAVWSALAGTAKELLRKRGEPHAGGLMRTQLARRTQEFLGA